MRFDERVAAMVFDLDIWHAANDLLLRYGKRATVQAARRMDDCLRTGDHLGQREWLRILRAVESMQGKKAPSPARRAAPELTVVGEPRILYANDTMWKWK